MNWNIRFWQVKKWILLHLTDSCYLNLPRGYHAQFLESLGDQSEMRIGGKPLTIYITGLSIIGVGKLEWVATAQHLHHVMIICNERGLCQFERNVLSQYVSHSIIEGNLPPHVMAEKVKELIDK